MKINKYPDGTSYVTLPKDHSLDPIVFKLNDYKDLWHLNQFVDVWNFRYGKLGIKPTIIIPNLIDAQADRRFNDNESSGLKLVCKFLNGLDANFKIFHPHNPEVVESLMDNVEIIDNKNFIGRQVLNSIRKGDKIKYPAIVDDKYIGPQGWYRDSRIDENLILMSSDAGGFKPLMKLATQLEWKGESLSCSKYRPANGSNNHKLIQQVPREDFEGKDILIIDDISVYGGTFKGLAKLLKERNCGKLYLAVSHMTIENLGEDPITNYFDKVFTTNSKFDEYSTNPEKWNSRGTYSPENLEIIKLF